jgi:tetratricopeptide (TPR) repeat protein
LSEAAAAYRAALAVRPDHHKAWNNLAKVHQDQGEVDAALDAYLRALYLQPDYVEARFNLATVRLLKGDYRAAWEDYECRFRRSDWRRFYPHRLDQPRWKGDVFPGKTLLVHCEQGFGDMFQFVRYLPMVKARGGTVVLETRHAARRLFERLTGVDRVVTFSPEHPPTVDYDFYAPLLSLPGLFQTSLETVPRNIPYLSADPLQAREWDGEFDRTQLHVGLIWAGTATDPCRAAPLAWFTTLTQLPGIRIHGLQKGPAADLLEREGLPLGMRMQNLGPRLKDFSDTAAVIDRLDLIVSIDTSVAHLAGAMGKPVYLLLPAAADWRWLRQREDSPWYPTMRLFRQKAAGDWGPPLTRIARRLDWLGRMLQHARSQTGGGDLLAAARRLHHQGHPIEASIFYRRGRQASSC